MRFVSCMCALLYAFTGAASAADLGSIKDTPPPTAQPSWTGLYLGVHGGYGWGDKSWTVDTSGEIDGFAIDGDIEGGLGGVQAGLNYQADRYVIGIEGQWSWTDIDGSHTGSVFGFTNRLGADVEWLAMLTGRLGYAYDRWLLYGMGGLVWARDRYTANIGEFAALQFEADETRMGWTAGGGAEYALSGNWSMRLEYNYMRIESGRSGGGGDINFGLGVVPVPPPPPPTPPTSFDSEIDQEMSVVKFGIVYRFCPPS